jgi:hypothetical protein
MPTMGEVARCFGPLYATRYGEGMLPSHRRTLADLAACRTPVMGGCRYVCRDCGKKHYAYLSCRNRHCTTCSKVEREQWIAKRHAEMPPVPCWHITFTLPSELRISCRKHQRIAYGILMKSAAKAVIELALDPRFVGGTVPVLAVLHTWRRDIHYHPHAHLLVSGGGLDGNGRWVDVKNPKFLVPYAALSKLFRGKFMAEMKRLLPEVKISPKVWKKAWVVKCKKVDCEPRRVIEYLGRYVHRVAISDNRILKIDNGKVTYSYKPNNGSWTTATIPGEKFLGLFLQHVLPSGFCKVRYYGLWHPSNRKQLYRAHAQLILAGRGRPQSTNQVDDAESTTDQAQPIKPRTCPSCGSTQVYLSRDLPRQRPPPWQLKLRFPHHVQFAV